MAVGTQLLLAAPCFQALAMGSFTSGEMQALATGTPLGQLPLRGMLLVALALLHAWLRHVRPLARWLPALLVGFGFYGRGIMYMQEQMYHYAWLVLRPADWLAFRTASQVRFSQVFMLPSYFSILPLLMIRPPGIPRWIVALKILDFR